MFGITPRDILRLQGSGGEALTHFVDQLIRAHSNAHGLLDSQVATNIRTSIADGGVDTTVAAALPGDTTGWFLDVPTVWQYKGTRYADIGGDVTSGELLKGEYLRARLTAGAAFRLVVADAMPPATREDWEAKLAVHATKLNPNAPQPMVLTADDLLAFGRRYPAILMLMFRGEWYGKIELLEAWGRNITDKTKAFVSIPEWSAATEAATAHVDLSRTSSSAVLTLQGEAGVGKTRLAYESVVRIQGAAALVMYGRGSEDVTSVARALANTENARAVLVADECDLVARLHLEDVLRGHRDRIRVLAIDNTGDWGRTGDPGLILGKMAQPALDEVLKLNFPTVTDERRRAFARLAEGFPRLAIDLCDWDVAGAAGTPVGTIPATVEDYIRVRLTPEQREALALLSLVLKVGWSGDIRGQLDELAQAVGLSRDEVQRHLFAIQNGPGFVVVAGRFIYVTPMIVASALFAEAWRRWAQDSALFLANVPPSLLPSFLERVKASAREEVRLLVAAHFRGWAESLTPESLTDREAVVGLLAIVETHPAEYLPRLERLVVRSTSEQLRAVVGRGDALGRWGPRRELVWCAERLAQFPEYFVSAQRILLALALSENEQGIANNATAIWQQLYRLYLSGTAVPFADRLELLKQQVAVDPVAVGALAVHALEASLDTSYHRTMGPAVVGGRVPPADWRPKTRGEEQECLEKVVAGLLSFVSGVESVSSLARKALLESFRVLIARGFLSRVVSEFSSISLSDAEFVQLVEAIDTALAYDGAGDEPRLSAETQEELRTWRRALTTPSIHREVLAVVGKGRWTPSRVRAHVRAQEAGGAKETSEIDDLAGRLLSSGEQFTNELAWLVSEAAESAGDLGVAIAKQDPAGSRLDEIFDAAAKGANRSLARGYAFGVLGSNARLISSVNRCLDRLESISPEVAVDIAFAGPEEYRAFERVVAAYDAGKLPPGYLFPRHFVGTSGGELPVAILSALLTRLAAAANKGDHIARRIGLDGLALQLAYDPPLEPLPLFVENADLTAAAWDLADGGDHVGASYSHWWRSVVVALGRLDPTRACAIAGKALMSETFGDREAAEDALTQLAKSGPGEVMEEVGRIMLDEKAGWRFYIGAYRELFASIPDAVVKAWVDNHGVKAARLLARHLPEPYLGPQETGVLPELTEWVLTRFQDDERVLQEFSAGMHNLKMYSGDIAGAHEEEARVARAFLSHPNPRVREWAGIEERRATADAAQARQSEAEWGAP